MGNYTFKTLSKRQQNMNELTSYSSSILLFLNDYFPSKSSEELEEFIKNGINTEWSGAVLSLDKDILIGFMCFTEVNPSEATYQVGFAYVDKFHRDEKVWTHMSGDLIDEVGKMGGKFLRRYTDDENLVRHLMNDGYKFVGPEDLGRYRKLEKRL